MLSLLLVPGLLALHGVEGEVAHDALKHVVPAGGVAADEARRVSEGHRVVLGDVAVLPGVVDEGIKVVADDFGHAGRADGDHVGLVDRLGVLQAREHVLLAAEHRRVLGHRVGDAGDRLLEVAVEIGAEIGHAALRTMDIGQGFLEPQAHSTAPSG